LIEGPELVGNMQEGHPTPRIEAITREQLDAETEQMYEEAMQKIEDFDEDQLFTEENVEVILN
jgi:hypothetical protein